MINTFRLLRNIGTFDSVDNAARMPLGRLTLIYAENGRGKSTLSAILRSLATGNPIPIQERKRLATQHPPHVIIDCAGASSVAIFKDNAWDQTFPNMVVFDDQFIDENVYSGLAVGAAHRQKLHDLILGAQGVSLNQQLQKLIERVEIHNMSLRALAVDISITERGALSIDDFCALPANANVEQEIQVAEQSLIASREQDSIQNTPTIDLLTLPPAIDLESIERVLHDDLSDLDTIAAAQVQSHLALMGTGAEKWLSDGMRFQEGQQAHLVNQCVFCAQDLANSLVITHYRAFFSDAYRQLQQRIVGSLNALELAHTDSAADFERAVRVLVERRQFWTQFADMPALNIDTTVIVRDWHAARDLVIGLLIRKREVPLEIIPVTREVRTAVETYDGHLAALRVVNHQLEQANELISTVKLRAITLDPILINATLSRLQSVRSRFTPATSAQCAAYLLEKQAKTATEQSRDHTRTALDEYRSEVFPKYQMAINRYLAKFNTGFRLDSVTATNTRGGSTCDYNVIINNMPVAVAGGEPQPGTHSFRNIMSAGDRNALALAFFFASLDLDLNLAEKVIVIDDPVSSLDDHRSLTTVQEIRDLAMRVSQVIILSHSKPFLCQVWKGADTTIRVALHIVRNGNGSTIESWDVNQDLISEHDRRHEALREYSVNGGQNDRVIAGSIRPLLEAFLRVACPEYFPPGTLLGPFRETCKLRLNTDKQILDAEDVRELNEIVEYANLFHHDTNTADWQTVHIDAGLLTGYVNRALLFTKRR